MLLFKKIYAENSEQLIVDNNNIKSRVEQVAEIGGSCLYASACFVVILIRGVTMVKGCNRHPYFYFD